MSLYILGVDPGTRHWSAALLEYDAPNLRCLDVTHSQYPDGLSVTEKLLRAHDEFKAFVLPKEIHVASFETQFLGKNVKTLRRLCESVGVMKLTTSLYSKAEIVDATPGEMKIAMTGNGRASKNQMASAVKKYFGIKCESKDKDEADAVAAALAFILYTPGMIAPILADAKEDALVSEIDEWDQLSDGRKNELKKKIHEVVLLGGVIRFTKSRGKE